jgi:uncharacterized membrane protein YhhN
MHTTKFSKNERLFIIVFVAIVLLELALGYTEVFLRVHYFTKPAIVVSLIVAFLTFFKNEDLTLKKLVLGGLCLSVIGDVLLMMVNDWPLAFTFGLLAFLSAHVLYCSAFWRQKNTHKSALPVLLPLVVYASTIVFVIKNNLGEMMIPVLIYILVISAMATISYLRIKENQTFSYLACTCRSAKFFMISDSLLAFNKFLCPVFHLLRYQ